MDDNTLVFAVVRLVKNIYKKTWKEHLCNGDWQVFCVHLPLQWRGVSPGGLSVNFVGKDFIGWKIMIGFLISDSLNTVYKSGKVIDVEYYIYLHHTGSLGNKKITE